MQQESFVALEGMAQGAVSERFSEEFQKVLLNIFDLNTEADAKRQIVIKVDIKPNKQRNFASVAVQVSAKLAPHDPTYVTFNLGKIGHQIEATEIKAEQPSFLPAPVPAEAQ